MISFASLFLGLVFGPRPVEVVPSPAVAAVEIRLDDRVLARLEEPPWRTVCDFGPEIVPARLRAVAFDAAGAEIGDAEQWINLPRPRADLDGTLDPGPPPVLDLRWESSAGAEPKSVAVTLDGAPLAAPDPRRIVLPEVDPDVLHVLNVEMEFEDGVSSRLDLTFGGRFVDETSTEMTALPVRTTGRRAPTPESAEGWFTAAGETLRVVSFEREPAEIHVVMGRPFPHLLDPTERQKVPKELGLPDDVRIRFVSPAPEHARGVVTDFALFPVSPAYDGKMGDAYWMLTRIRPTDRDKERDLGAAVAVAGSGAFRSRRRRAVVYVPPSRPVAADELRPDVVRRYLERLHVPFVVWDPEAGGSPGAEAWGAARDVGSLKDLARAFGDLVADLDSQWIVWLEGRHLPQDVETTAEAKGVELVGGG